MKTRHRKQEQPAEHLRSALVALAMALLLTSVGSCRAQQRTNQPSSTPADGWMHVHEAGAELAVRFDWDAATGNLERVHYRIRNPGQAPLMIMDAGSAQAGNHHARRSLAPQPDEAGRLSYTLAAWPLSQPPPTVPILPVATRLEPGQLRSTTLSTGSDFMGVQARAVRFCLGIAPWDPEDYLALDEAAHRWQVSLTVSEKQQAILCSDWAQPPAQADEEDAESPPAESGIMPNIHLSSKSREQDSWKSKVRV